MANASISIPILAANNYNNWEFRIKTLFKGESCIEALNEPPAANASSDAKDKYLKTDAKAQTIIIQGVSDKHLDIIICKNSIQKISKN